MGAGFALVLGLGIGALAVGAAALVIACLALIEIKAQQRSTHSIEYINPQTLFTPDPPSAPSDRELEKMAKREGFIPVDDDEDFEDL